MGDQKSLGEDLDSEKAMDPAMAAHIAKAAAMRAGLEVTALKTSVFLVLTVLVKRGLLTEDEVISAFKLPREAAADLPSRTRLDEEKFEILEQLAQEAEEWLRDIT